MPAFRVDPAALAAAVDLMTTFDRDMEEHLAQVNATAQRMGTGTAGETASAADEAHRRWQTGAAQMRAALTALQRMAGRAHTNYTGAITKNSEMWGSA